MNAPSDELFTRLRAAVVERYELKELLGRGGMGAVFLAIDRKLDRPVAIKVLPPELSHDENIVERFEREARTAAKLDHPNIIPVYSVESHGDFHYFVMKFVAGRSLEQILDAGPMPVDLARRIVWEAACALGHAHRRDVVHRDIKPANIMIDDSGRAVLTDFGISKALQSAAHQLTATGQVVGTPHYMSPEQGKGVDVDGRSDQYSLAVVAYRMLTNKLPFDEDSFHAVLYKKIFEDPRWVKDLRDDIPDHMAEALHKALAREPENRFESMEAFASAIWPENPVEEPGLSVARTARSAIEGDTQISPTEAPRRRRLWAVSIVISLVVLGGGAGGAWLGRGLERQDDQPEAGLVTLAADPGFQAAGPATVDSLVVASSPPPAQGTPGEEQEQPPAEGTTTPQVEDRPAGTDERTTTTARRSTPPPLATPPVGYVTINAMPFGTVWIDGVRIDDTPVVRFELTPGKHVIEIRRVGFRTVVDTVEITASNERRLTKVLVREP